MQSFQDFARIVSTGAPAVNLLTGQGAVVSVWLAGTQTLAAIFASNAAAPLANPMGASATTGQFRFYAANGRYDVLVTPPAGIGPAYTLGDILLDDPVG